MCRHFQIAVTVVALCGGIAIARGAEKKPTISAPVVYKKLMLVLVTSDGAAAVVFNETYKEEFSDTEDRYCLVYRYRYESRDGKTKKSGTGVIYERYTKGKYDKGELWITAGPIKLEWSRGGEKMGWIYYAPEKIRVHIANASNFEAVKQPLGRMSKQLDLRRFLK